MEGVSEGVGEEGVSNPLLGLGVSPPSEETLTVAAPDSLSARALSV
jgi:hypothetical protein